MKSTFSHILRTLLLILLTALISHSGAGPCERPPLTANLQDSASSRWLEKKVLESRILDDMESLGGWTAFTHGPEGVVDARVTAAVTRASSVVAEMTLTSERSRDGKHSLRLRNPTRLDRPGPASGRGWGQSGVTRHFDGEDWSHFNRISLWIYPDCPGHYVAALDLHLHNDGIEKLPAAFGQEGETSLVMQNHEWNHVVWEIGNVARDKVTGLEIAYYMAGNEPDGADQVEFDFDDLELQRVEPDYIEGWGVWPGRVSFSQAGYSTGSSKSAIASGLGASEFSLIDQKTGRAALRKPVQTVKTHLGDFQVMDFSEVWQSGSYFLEAGGARTQPFQIGPDVWRESIWKALNFLYCERCGMAIPGVHGACHRDWTVVHGDKRIVINGGWHDAGDLTQGLGNTGEIVYALFSLAERLHARGEDPELYDRLVEEGEWGLDWILKTSFGDGYRDVGSISSRHTNGIIGDFDDVTATARNTPMANFTASAAEAIAHRVLKDRDPRLAAYSLKMAEADWQFAVEGLKTSTSPTSKELFQVSFDSAGVVHDVASVGVLASVDLWRATGKQRYAEKALELAKIILDSQERKRQDWTTPLCGFFYCSPAKDRILHYCHRGREQGPVLALTRLCSAFPDHPDWMKWYSAVVFYSQYLKTIAKYTEPYGVLPASIYRDDDYLQVPESRRESFRRQVLNGIELGHGYYLRLFPVWMDYRGHFGTILPQAQALAAAGHLRGDLDSTRLSEHQLEWVIGRNPFAQSTMWGEGYDFAPLYSPSSGDMVGSLPVGIQTRGDKDAPYWPVQSTWTYKEVWVHPVARWIWLMTDLAGPALVEGSAESLVEFEETTCRQRFAVHPDPATGRIRTTLPEGHYIITCGAGQQSRTFLPGGTYRLDFRPERVLDFQVARAKSQEGEVAFQVIAQGSGKHRFTVRTENLMLRDAARELILQPGVAGILTWNARIESQDTPWVVVVVPDDDLSRRMELTGTP
jgi:hypothetical protein